MSQGDSIVVAVGAAMTLILVRRALLGSRLSFKTKAWMALAWAVLIAGVAVVASWWRS